MPSRSGARRTACPPGAMRSPRSRYGTWWPMSGHSPPRRAPPLPGNGSTRPECAGCHGPNGDPAESQAASLQRPSRSLAAILDRAEHSDADVFTVVTKGVAGTPMPAFGATLSEADRWAVVSFLRTLSLAGAPGTDAGALEPDRAAELADVRRVVDAAVDARRRGDPDAHAIATNAYLRFGHSSGSLQRRTRPASRRSNSRSSRSAPRFATPRRAIPTRSGGSSAPTSTRPRRSSVPAAPRARRRHPGLARAWRSSPACSSPPEPIYSGCTRAARFPRAAGRPEPVPATISLTKRRHAAYRPW